ncbi:MAG: iron-containing redox enzyme family protein [Deltaproteobacteria bacterium]|nr:iron-containing redox enzyme family protein [Deltaproteobacteria bacterium]
MEIIRESNTVPEPLLGEPFPWGPAADVSIARIERLVQEHPLWSHPFLVRCRQRELGMAEVRALSVQMYKFSREFCRYLAAVLLVCPDQEAQLVVADNLWDELGEGRASHSHPELFRVFTRSLEIDDATLEATPAEPETLALIGTYLGMAETRGFQAAVGAICYASEGIVGSLYRQLQEGIEACAALPREALLFFELHVEVDDGHKARLEALLRGHMRTPEDSRVVVTAVTEALNARYRFLDGVTRLAASA